MGEDYFKQFFDYSNEQLDESLKKLQNLKCSDETLKKTLAGNKFLDKFFFNKRIQTIGNRGINFPTFYKQRKKWLKKAYIKKNFDFNKTDHPSLKNNPKKNLFKVYGLYFSSINQFKPSLAKSIYCKYKPKRVLDFSAGWGGRLLGAMVLPDIHYTGIDTNVALKKPYTDLIKRLGVKNRVKMIWKDSSKVDYSKLKYDMVFTSPPYFMLEKYQNMPQYKNKEDFVEKFYKPVIIKTFTNLEKGGNYILNIPVEMYEITKKILGGADKKIPLKMNIRGLERQKMGKDYTEYIYVWKKDDKRLEGAGFWDWTKRQYRRTKQLFQAPKQYSNTSRKTLDEYGKCKITKLVIMRTPLQEVLGIALQGLSLGKWYDLMRKYGYDKMFHLALIGIVCDNVAVVIEKNEVVNISNSFDISADSECMEVDLPKSITLDQMMNNTKAFMGDFNYFDYDAFKNNCQNFICSILQSNGLLTPEYQDFLYQDIRELHSELPTYISPVVKVITRLGSVVSRLRGQGRLGDLLDKKKYPLNYSNEVVDVISTMSFGNNVDILGSMSFKSQLYTSDYDCFEVVKVKSIAELKRKFQNIIKNLKSMKNVYIGDIKLGSVDDWKVIDESAYIDNAGKLRGYNQQESSEKVRKLLEDKIISRKEYEESKKLLIKKPNYEELRHIIKQLRYNIVRWTPTEILKGEKQIRSRTYTLEEGFKSKSLFKLDVFALIGGTYTEFTIIYDIRLNGKRLNYFGIDTKQTLLNDIHLYHSIGNWFKLLKRLFSYYNYVLKYEKTSNKKKYIDNVEKIINILNSDIGILYTITQDIEVILFLMEKGITPRGQILDEISNFTNKINNVYQVNLNAHIYNTINNISKLKSNKAIKNKLEDLHKHFTTLLNKQTKKKIDKSVGLSEFI